METQRTEDFLISPEEKGSRLSALLSGIMNGQNGEEPEESEEEISVCSENDSLKTVLESTEKIRGSARRIEAANTVGPEQELYLVEVLNDIRDLRNSLSDVIQENPLFKTNLIILEKLVGEYDKLDKQIDDFLDVVNRLSGIKLTGERSRVRDNLTQLVTERWRLLNSVLDNVNKLHGNVVKARIKGTLSGDDDLFSGYAKYAEGKDHESKGSE